MLIPNAIKPVMLGYFMAQVLFINGISGGDRPLQKMRFSQLNFIDKV